MKLKVLSIIPAQPGWVAKFRLDDGTICEKQVAIWAVVVDDDGQRVTGFSETDGCGFMEPDDTVSNFEGWGTATPNVELTDTELQKKEL